MKLTHQLFFCLKMKGVEQIEHTLHNLRSPKRGHTFWGWLAVMALAFLLMLPTHGEWLRAPNEFMFGESPDGFKNYMTSSWHVERDSSYVHYGGMGYPYGEHVLFTDNQPIVSAAMQWWSRHVSDLTGRTVGIVNMIQLLSLVFGAGIIFLLFRKLHLPVWCAGIAALGMVFLSPQYNRFDGHFGLSHTWVFPLLLLLLCRYEERHSRRYQSLQIGFLVWLAAQLHFYYFGLAALFLGLYMGFQLLHDPSARNFRVRLSHLVVMLLVPFVLLNIWIHWSDYTTDRPASPWGFTTYIGYWEGVLLPYKEFPLYKWMDENIVKIRRVDYETQAYAGFSVLVFVVWFMFFRRFRLFDKSWEEMAHHRVHQRFLRGIFTAAFVLLILSCGFPFAIEGMEWMTDYFGPFRQFRGLGRFTWAFYYVANVVLFYILWNKSLRFKGFLKKEKILPPPSSDESDKGQGTKGKGQGATNNEQQTTNNEQRKYPWFRWVIIAAPLAMLVYEAVVFQKTRRLPLSPNVARRETAIATCPWIDKVDFSQFQALLPLPYYHVGSENIWLDLGDAQLFRRVQTTAVQTGVPDMGVNMSRTSVGHMVKSVQFVHNPCEPPVLLHDLPDDRPIALMIPPSKWDEVRSNYRHLVESAKLVYEHPDMKIMSLAPDSLHAWSRRQALGILEELETRPLFPAGKIWKCDREQFWLHYNSYDSLTTTEHIFQGKGAYEGNMGDTTWLWNRHIPKGDFFLSLWIYVKQDMGMTHEVKIVENNRGDGHEVHFKHEGLRFYLRSIVNGWALYDLYFKVHEDDSNLNIFLEKRGVREPFFVDEVMIKRNDFTLYRQVPGWVLRNDFWYKLPDR